MPRLKYKCNECGYAFSVPIDEGNTSPPLASCPDCGSFDTEEVNSYFDEDAGQFGPQE